MFRGCSGLTSIDIPNTVTIIEGLAFSGTGLTSLHIPANVTQVGTYLLSGSNNVTSITVDQANPNYDSRNNCNAIIETATNTLINACNNSTVPNGVRHIDGAFYGCNKITNIELPSSLYTIRYGSFMNCSSLKSIIVPEGVVQIDMDVFRNCTSLTSIVLPSTLQKAGLDHIGTYCFYGCYNLKDVTCFALTPPVIGPFYSCFESSTYQNATLHVPYEALARYKEASYWRYFQKIRAIGDVNGDGKLSIGDVTNLINVLLVGDNLSVDSDVNCDVNCDGKVSIGDVSALIEILLGKN